MTVPAWSARNPRSRSTSDTRTTSGSRVELASVPVPPRSSAPHVVADVVLGSAWAPPAWCWPTHAPTERLRRPGGQLAALLPHSSHRYRSRAHDLDLPFARSGPARRGEGGPTTAALVIIQSLCTRDYWRPLRHRRPPGRMDRGRLRCLIPTGSPAPS